LLNITPAPVGPSAGQITIRPRQYRSRPFAKTSIFQARAATCEVFWNVTNFTANAVGCDRHPERRQGIPGAIFKLILRATGGSAAPSPAREDSEPFCGRGSYAEIVIQREMMTKEKIAEALEEIGTLLELKDENPFKIRAYQNAARSIEAFGASFSDLQNQETLEKIPGVGKAIAAKISELATTGGLKFLDELRAEFPSAILELFSIPGLGAKKIKALYEQLKISSIADLQAACESGRVAELPGFGETTQTKICNAIANRAKHAGSFQFGEIAAEAEHL